MQWRRICFQLCLSAHKGVPVQGPVPPTLYARYHVQTLGLFPPLCRAKVTPTCTESWLFRTRSNLLNLDLTVQEPHRTCSNLFIIQPPPPHLGWQAQCSHSAEMSSLHKHFNTKSTFYLWQHRRQIEVSAAYK